MVYISYIFLIFCTRFDPENEPYKTKGENAFKKNHDRGLSLSTLRKNNFDQVENIDYNNLFSKRRTISTFTNPQFYKDNNDSNRKNDTFLDSIKNLQISENKPFNITHNNISNNSNRYVYNNDLFDKLRNSCSLNNTKMVDSGIVKSFANRVNKTSV